VNRKEFLSLLGKLTLSIGCTPVVADILSHECFGAEILNSKTTRKVLYHKPLSDKKIQCFVCPLNCVLKDGETCFCRTRTNYSGVLYSDAWANPAIVQFDPIEKGPFFHYMPGKKSLSIGTPGCNVRCLFCQNWELSQVVPYEAKTIYFPPEEVPKRALESDCIAITYTYTEPVSFYEYMLRISELSGQSSIKNLVATAAYINKKPLQELCKNVDAFAVSIKSFDEKSYKQISGIEMKPVLEAIETIKEEGKWLEFVYVIIPTMNDSPDGMKELFKWIYTNLGEDIPLHLARFAPSYKLKNLPRTPLAQMEEAGNSAKDAGLKYVYLDNVPGHKGNNTYCPNCGSAIIERVGFEVLKNNIIAGKCSKCGHNIPGVWI
jgi:pyruvate formate lyase activating enzyme